MKKTIIVLVVILCAILMYNISKKENFQTAPSVSVPTQGTSSVSTITGTSSAASQPTVSVPTQGTSSAASQPTVSVLTQGTSSVASQPTVLVPTQGTSSIASQPTVLVPTQGTSSIASQPTVLVPTQGTTSVSTSTSPTSTTSVPVDFLSDNLKEEIKENLTKISCIDKENKCNLGHQPYSKLRLDGINPETNQIFTNKEKQNLKKLYNNKCKSFKNHKIANCCDPNDDRLNNVYSVLPDEIKNAFGKVEVTKCNNKIQSIKLCENEEDCPNGQTPNAYQLCKLMNVNRSDLDKDNYVNLQKLSPDCYDSKCSNNGLFLEIDKKKNQNELITKHYYLIEATKNDDVNYIKDYFDKDMTISVNDKLQYGYPGNNIVHEIVMNDALTCFEYIITLNIDLSVSNKDGNTSLHLACLKGNYDMVNKLLKLGGSVICGNNEGDTPLHCAARSGSYNSAMIIINNGGSASIISKNNYGETPLHTNVAGEKRNFKLVELLVENGSDVHNIDKYNNTILKTLSKQPKSIASEEIRTYLQRIYYQKYDEDEYAKLLNKYPEIRPFILDTSIEEKLEDDFKEYENKVNYRNMVTYTDEDIKNKKLYVNKETGILKDKIPEKYTSIEHFSNNEELSLMDNLKTTNKNVYVFLILLFVVIGILYLRN